MKDGYSQQKATIGDVSILYSRYIPEHNATTNEIVSFVDVEVAISATKDMFNKKAEYKKVEGYEFNVKQDGKEFRNSEDFVRHQLASETALILELPLADELSCTGKE